MMVKKKAATKSTKKAKVPHLTLHQLIGALSFWGTSARGLLLVFLMTPVYLVVLSETSTMMAAETQTKLLIYAVAAFIATDFGYVMIARAYPLIKMLDITILALADVLLAALYILPKLVVTDDVVLTIDPILWAAFVPLLVLSIRMLAGFLYTKK